MMITRMMARLHRAREAVQSGRFEEATTEYIWLWDNMLVEEPSMAGVRCNSFIGSLQELLVAYPAARSRIEEARGGADPPAADAVERPLLDWVLLNDALGEPERNLAWFDSHPMPSDRRLLDWLALSIEPLLIERRRWADVAVFHPEPEREVREQFIRRGALALTPLGELPQSVAEWTREEAIKIRERVGQLVHCLRAVGRTSEAERCAAIAREEDPTREMQVALELTP